MPIEIGHNTRQILNYGYRFWHQLFNERQLLALTMLATALQTLPAGEARDALALLFSGTLEFNNMFASYKGEGTGAVRHMFSHHILKPERTPIEANLWGTPKSSGAFSTLYKSRLLRALDYRDAPFEISVERHRIGNSGRKIFGVSPPMGTPTLDAYPKDGLAPGTTYLSCGDSASTDLPDKSVHLVITDPPFFDNVHYSELADFFHAWQEIYFSDQCDSNGTTRRPEEVQDTDACRFSKKLKAVFQECNRVLRDQGLLVFSYHHSRNSGWKAVAKAVLGAGFSMVQSQPVKSEMSVASPKRQAKHPIDLDMLVICRKHTDDRRKRRADMDTLRAAQEACRHRVERFTTGGRELSLNDVRVIFRSQLLVELSAGREADEVEHSFDLLLPKTDRLTDEIWRSQQIQAPSSDIVPPITQISLFKTSSTA